MILHTNSKKLNKKNHVSNAQEMSIKFWVSKLNTVHDGMTRFVAFECWFRGCSHPQFRMWVEFSLANRSIDSKLESSTQISYSKRKCSVILLAAFLILLLNEAGIKNHGMPDSDTNSIWNRNPLSDGSILVCRDRHGFHWNSITALG